MGRVYTSIPLWTLQRLRFEPDVAAARPTDRGENRDPGSGNHILTKEMRLENGSALEVMRAYRGLTRQVR